MSPESTTSPKAAAPRSRRKTEIGIVTSDKMNKTRRVEVQRLVPHPKYGKLMRRRTVCHVHDEANESHKGDTVEIMETRKLSKTKNWRLVRVIKKGGVAGIPGVDAPAAPAQA